MFCPSLLSLNADVSQPTCVRHCITCILLRKRFTQAADVPLIILMIMHAITVLTFLPLIISPFLSTNRQYKLCMYAIGSEYGNSAVSNSLLINTPGSRFCAGQMLDSSLVDFESWEASDQTDLKVGNVR